MIKLFKPKPMVAYEYHRYYEDSAPTHDYRAASFELTVPLNGKKNIRTVCAVSGSYIKYEIREEFDIIGNVWVEEIESRNGINLVPEFKEPKDFMESLGFIVKPHSNFDLNWDW